MLTRRAATHPLFGPGAGLVWFSLHGAHLLPRACGSARKATAGKPDADKPPPPMSASVRRIMARDGGVAAAAVRDGGGA
ncbi:hypothetical protein OAO87_04300 [bacterium]|nr:hypothetical protein [bacterium]